MPSEKVLEQKKALVSDLSDRLKNSISGVVVSYEGITVEDDTKLRKELREAGVSYTVIKNTMLGRAAEQVGLEGLKPVLEGTTALATCDEDYAAPARILCKYADAHDNFAVKSGYIDEEVIEMDKIVSLSKLPTRDVLLANVLGAFQAPIASFARAIQAVVDQSGEATDAPAEEAAEA
ncbi:MAG TPA: 50S ribosomal protein L10 [Clostridiales bacterium]|nr:50S ribosomal protein L10 [Clostridiales bacterium]